MDKSNKNTTDDKFNVTHMLNCPHDWCHNTVTADNSNTDIQCSLKLFNDITVRSKSRPIVSVFSDTMSMPVDFLAKVNRISITWRSNIEKYLPLECRTTEFKHSPETAWVLLPPKAIEKEDVQVALTPVMSEKYVAVSTVASSSKKNVEVIDEDTTPLRKQVEKKKRKTEDEDKTQPGTSTKKVQRINIDEISQNFQPHDYQAAALPKWMGSGSGSAGNQKLNTPKTGKDKSYQQAQNSGKQQFYDPTKGQQIALARIGTPVQRPRQQKGKSVTYSSRGGQQNVRIPWPKK